MSPRQITIRPAEPGDGAAVAAIYAPIVLRTAISFEADAPTPETMAQRIETTLERYPWLVAEREGEVVGYAYASEHQARAAYRWSVNVTVYVAAAAHGQGVGRALYGVLTAILRGQGFRSAFAGIALPNQASVGLHEAGGFEPVGIYRDVGFKLGGWRDVGWWRLGLTHSAEAPAEPIPFARFRETVAFDAIMG